MTTPACLTSAGTLIEDFDLASEWTTDSTLYNATVTRFTREIGGLSIRTSLKSTATSGYITKTINLDMSNLYTPAMSLDYHSMGNFSISAYSSTAKITIEFSSTSDFSKSFKYTSPYMENCGFQRIQVGSTEWTNTGGESWSNTMIRMRIGLSTLSAGLMPMIHLDELRGGVVTTPYVSIVMYGTYQGQYDHAFPALTSRGLKATLLPNVPMVGRSPITPSIPPALVGALGWSSAKHDWPELMEMYEAGFPVMIFPHMLYDDVGHSFSEQATEEIIDEVGETIKELRSHGIIDIIPFTKYATYDERTMSILKSIGILGSIFASGRDYVHTPVYDPYQYQSKDLSGSLTLATATGWIDKIKASGRSLILYVYDIEDSGTGDHWEESDFASLLDYIIAQDIEVKTLDELYTLTTGNAITSNHIDSVETNLEMFSGDKTAINITIPRSLVGCTVSWVIAESPGSAPLITKVPTITNSTLGKVEVDMLWVDTEHLKGTYYHEIQVTDMAGLVQTLVYGRLKIYPTSTSR